MAALSRNAVEHRVVFQVDSEDEATMKHAISGSINAAQYYNSRHENVAIEIVANAAGIRMFREDTSPVTDGVRMLRQLVPTIRLSVCGSSKTIAERKEGHSISMFDGVVVVPYGVGRLIDLQETGWSYIHA